MKEHASGDLPSLESNLHILAVYGDVELHEGINHFFTQEPPLARGRSLISDRPLIEVIPRECLYLKPFQRTSNGADDLTIITRVFICSDQADILPTF